MQVFLWFPMQSKFDYIPPNLVSEGLHFQLERVVKLAKAARSDLSQVTGGHLSIEEQIIRNIISSPYKKYVMYDVYDVCILKG